MQTALIQKDIDLAVLQERLVNQEMCIENEMKMKKFALNDGKLNEVITKGVDAPALECKS